MITYLGILYIQSDGRITGGEVSVEVDAIGDDLIPVYKVTGCHYKLNLHLMNLVNLSLPLHRNDRIDFSGGRVVYGAALIVLENAKAGVMADVPNSKRSITEGWLFNCDGRFGDLWYVLLVFYVKV